MYEVKFSLRGMAKAYTALVGVTGLLSLLPLYKAQAISITWDGGAADSLWHTPNNWNPNQVPTGVDDATINNDTVTVRGSRAANNLTIDNATTLKIEGNAALANGVLTVGNGFNNPGTIRLDSTSAHQATLDVTTGTLNNQSFLIFNFGTGTGHTRNLGANLNNTGTVDIEGGGTIVNLDKASGQYENQGTINIGNGSTLGFAATAGTFTQTSGAVNNSGTFSFSGDTFNFNGGNLTGNAVNLVSSDLNFGAGAGMGSFIARGGSGTLSGNVPATDTFTLQGDGTFANAVVTAANGFNNQGIINLDSISAHQATLDVTAGTLNNQNQLNFKFGTGTGHTRNLGANLNNTGTADIEGGGTIVNLDKASGQYQNQGTINIGNGSTLGFGGTLGTFTQTSGAVNNSGTFSFSGDTFNFNGGNLTGNAVNLVSSDLNFGAGAGMGSFIARGGSGTLSGNVPATGTLTLQGDGTFANAVVIAANGFNNQGIINLDSISAHQATLDVTAGTLNNQNQLNFKFGAGSGHTRNLGANLNNTGTASIEDGTTANFDKASGVYDNSGTILLKGPGSLLDVVSGDLNNLPGGMIKGNGKIDLLNAAGSLDNGGTVGPGSSAGHLTISGSLLNQASAIIAIELGGTGQGVTYDLLDISKTFAINNGALDVRFIGGFQSLIQPSDLFDIIKVGSATTVFGSNITGMFGNVDLGNRVMTGDGFGSFLVTILTDVQGKTDIIRLSDFQANQNAIPEPSDYLLLLTGVVFLAGCIRRRSLQPG